MTEPSSAAEGDSPAISEAQVVAADTAQALTRSEPPAKPTCTHTHCLNCGARLQGRFCHDCGQGADDHHRSIAHLAWEAVEGLTHLDGRLAHTLPALLVFPGRLARDHIEGRRARHVPPFRLFLICLLIFMFAMEALVHARRTHPGPTRAGLQTAAAGKLSLVVTEKGRTTTEPLNDVDLAGEGPAARWVVANLQRVVKSPDFFEVLVFDWAHRLAVLMLPILAGLLTLLYVYKRRFYVYDHLVVAMQFLSFVFLLWAVVFSAPAPVAGLAFGVGAVWTPLNLYLILRRAYGSSRLGAVVKALFLWIATCVLFVALLAALVALALHQL